MSNNCENSHDNFPEPKVKSSNGFFYPTTSPKPEDSSFTIMEDKEKQQMLKFKKMVSANV